MRRRDFIRIFGLAAALPLAARAQQAVPVIGFIGGETPEQYADRLGAFHQGLREIGFVEGQNVPVEYRWAQSQYGRLPELAAGPSGTATGPLLSLSMDEIPRSSLLVPVTRPQRAPAHFILRVIARLSNYGS
jgi:hypothetical protein